MTPSLTRTWTKKDVELIRDHLNRDMSAREIAKHIGKSQHAVYWAAKRLRMEGYNVPKLLNGSVTHIIRKMKEKESEGTIAK